MPTSVAGQLKFDQADSFKRQSQMGKLGEYLTMKWKTKFGGSKTWTMWDVALIEAILDPTMCEEKQVKTPPENEPRDIWMYTDIDEAKMKTLFWKSVQ